MHNYTVERSSALSPTGKWRTEITDKRFIYLFLNGPMTDCHGESGRSQEEGGGSDRLLRVSKVSSIMTVIISTLLFTIINYQW